MKEKSLCILDSKHVSVCSRDESLSPPYTLWSAPEKASAQRVKEHAAHCLTCSGSSEVKAEMEREEAEKEACIRPVCVCEIDLQYYNTHFFIWSIILSHSGLY